MGHPLAFPTDSPPIWEVPCQPLQELLGALGPFFPANNGKLALQLSAPGQRLGWIEIPPFGTLAVRLPGRVESFDTWLAGMDMDSLPRLGLTGLFVGHSAARGSNPRHHWMLRTARAHTQ